MKKIALLCLLFLSLSCNDRQKKEQALRQLEEAQQEIPKLKHAKEILAAEIVSLKAELELANDQLARTKEFHFLRTEEERDQQIRDAVEKIEQIEQSIKDDRTKINTIEESAQNAQNCIVSLKEILKN